MSRTNAAAGLTLVEMMVTVAVVAILGAIAFPAYRDYLDSARFGVMSDNIQSIRLMQAGHKADTGRFAEGAYDASAGDIGLSGRLGWTPGRSLDAIGYVVTCATDGAVAGQCARDSGYTVTATHRDAADSPVTMTFDERNECVGC